MNETLIPLGKAAKRPSKRRENDYFSLLSKRAARPNMSQFSPADVERFWKHVDRTSGGCWPWLSGRNRAGYGRFTIKPGRKQLHLNAHRVALFLTTGIWGDVTIHSCDNPSCCNPSHLRWGTQAENRADCADKGRTARGTRNGAWTHPDRRARGDSHPNAKLSDADVSEIRRIYTSRKDIEALASRYGVHPDTIYHIAKGHTRKPGGQLKLTGAA